MRLGPILAIACTVACTVEGGNKDPFGSGGPSTAGTTAPTSTDESGTSGSESSSGGSTTDDPSTSTTDPSTGTDATLTTTATTTMGGQPDMGMYSHCLDAAECMAPTNVCFQVLDGMMNVTDGFCTAAGCANPLADCDPAPGGTATPICYDITLNMVPDMACALDCQGGATCPTGMVCVSLQGGMVCA